MTDPSRYLLVPPAVVLIVLVYFFIIFLRHYWRPAKQLITTLQGLLAQIQNIKTRPIAERQHALGQVLRDTPLQNGWKEYDESLHPQYENRDGELVLCSSRATVPSSFYLTQQNIVDTRLKTEFFKHLPGILTGVGIIGTFGGLLLGLSAFDTSDPAKIQDSVILLLQAVRDAFIASAAAILAAMVVTVMEKSRLRESYALLEKLTEEIDQLFQGGVGEEYLAALVQNSEESAKQTRMLKDSLVNDLREMLQNLVDSQIRENLKLAEALATSYQSASESMASSVSLSIENSFREPLDKIAASVQNASGEQSNMVGNLLQEVLVAFMSKLEGTFGQQFHGMQEMMGQSVAAMQQMQAGFNQLVADMRTASESSGQAIQEQLGRTLQDMQQGQAAMQVAMQDMLAQMQQAVSGMGDQGEAAGLRMAEQLEKLFSQSEIRQQAMAEELQRFVSAMKENVGKGQQDIMDGIASSVDRMETQLDAMLSNFAQNREAMDKGALQAQHQLQQGTQQTVREMGSQVEQLLQALQQEREAGSLQVQQIGEQTEKALAGMKEGADRMRVAAERFEHASTAAASLSSAAGDASRAITGSCDGMSQATRELATQVAEYRSHREIVQKTLATLESIVASSKLEADARQKLAQDYRQLTDRIEQCNAEAASYLQRVNEVLTTSFTSFGSSMEGHVRKSMANMETELEKAIGLLAGGVNNLYENIEELSDVVSKAVAVR